MKTKTNPFANEQPVHGAQLRQKLQDGNMAYTGDPFADDALEAFSEHNVSLDDLDKLDASMPSNNTGNSFLNGVYGGGIAVLGLLIWLSLSERDRKSDSIEPSSSITAESKNQLPQIVIPEASQIDTNELHLQIAMAPSIPAKDQIRPEKLQSSIQSLAKPENPLPAATIEHFPVHSKNMTTIPSTPAKPVSMTSIKTIAVQNMVAVDYTQEYDRKIKIRVKEIPSGTRTYSMDKLDNPAEIVGPYIFIDYLDALDEALGFFSAGEYAKCVTKLTALLNLYPSDVNAMFYGALCRYNLGMFEESIEYFSMAATHPHNTFSEDALWYKSLALIKLNRLAESKKLLERIVAMDAFYAGKAKAKLKELSL